MRSLAYDREMELILLPPGRHPGIGPESGRPRRNGIGRFTSTFGSTRYLYYVGGQIVSGLQVVSREGRYAVIANVFTLPEYRRKKLAARLLQRARGDFISVSHAAPDSMSEDAKRWRERVG